ncbi:MAG: 4Fe-4S dicluster domain-containing protein [Chloroflexi bacterium]|nr:4Fe-4S dicluster domain-containing protein [Chloroflexota bacterium]
MKRIIPREEFCVACRLCEVFCRVAHSQTKDLIKAHKVESPPPLARLVVEDGGAISFALSCRHCEEPYCAYACLTGAMQKDPETGAVTVDPTKCTGCWTCILACPYGSIVRDEASHQVAKCDLCPGLPEPACVANCPNGALLYRETVHA